MCLWVIYFWIGCSFVGSTIQFEDDGRIVGGKPADIRNIPYQLSVRSAMWNIHICGASIISVNWAVSAAHCYEIFSLSTGLIIVAGTSFQSTGGSMHPVIKVITHPSYGTGTSTNNDIAVLQVKRNFPLGSPGVRCIPLATRPPATGVLALTSGWGALEEGSMVQDQLQKVWVPIIDNKICNKLYKNSITEEMVCAGYDEGGKDSCQGDSGGPLVVNNELVGVVSFGQGCGRAGFPGVYARVDKLFNWVRQVTGVSNCNARWLL